MIIINSNINNNHTKIVIIITTITVITDTLLSATTFQSIYTTFTHGFVPYILTYKSKCFEPFLALKVGESTYTRVSKFAASRHHSSKLSELYRQWLGMARSAFVCEMVKPIRPQLS